MNVLSFTTRMNPTLYFPADSHLSKENRRIAALSHNRMKASKNEMSAYPIDRTTEATIRKSLTPKLKNYRKSNLLSYPPVMRQCLNKTVDLYQKKEELLASFL